MANENELLIKLGVETSSAHKQIQEVTKELKQLEKQVKSVDNASDGFNSGLSGIAKKVDIYTNKIEALNTKLEVYEKTLEEAEYQMKTAQSSLDELGKRTSDNAKDWDTASKKLEIAQNKYNNTARAIQTTQLEIENTSNEIRKLNDSFEDMNFEKFSKEIDGLEKDLNSLDKQIDSIDTTTDSFSKNINGMGEQTNLYKQKIDILNESIEKHKKELESTKTAISSVEDWLRSLGERTEENAEEWDRASDYLEKYQGRHDDLERSLTDVQSELRITTQELSDLNKEMAQAPFDNLANKLDTLSGGFETLAQATLPITEAVSAVAILAGKTAMDYETAMAKVQAVSGATGSDFDKLCDKARDIGSTTSLSASEGAEALLLLAQAGYDTETSLAMVDGIVSLAIANEMDLAEATEIVTSAMASFHIEASETMGVVDVLSTVASASNSDVSDLGEAFKAVAPTASALGFTIEDTGVVLGLLANQAIKGGEAGNGLKSVLASLVSPTEDGAEALKDLGVEITEADGTMRPLVDIVADLQEGFSGLTEEEQAQVATTIAGKQQMSKFLAIVNSAPEDLVALTEAVADSNGATDEMRSIMEETSAGGLKELQSKLEETFIVIGQKLLPIFDDFVEILGEALDWFNQLDEGTQENIIKFAGLSAVISPVASGLSKICGGASNVVSVLGTLAGKLATTSTGIGGIGTATTTAGGIIGATGSGTLLGGLASIASAVAPWLIGGTIVLGLGYGIYKIIDDYDNLKNKIVEVEEEWSLANELTEEANKLLAESVEEDYKNIQESMNEFEDEGFQELINCMRTLNEDGTQDFTGFLEHLQTGMETSKIAVAKDAEELSSALNFLNTDVATVFSTEDLATIMDNWSGGMTQGLDNAYTNLENLVINKDGIILGLMEEHGVDYDTAYDTWEGWVLDGYVEFCDEMLKCQTGYQEESLGSVRTFLMEQGLMTRDDFDAGTKEIQEAYGRREDLLYLEYQEMLEATARGESAINGIQFESAEQARVYGDMVYEYKLAQLEQQKEEELQLLYDLAYEKGLISEEEYTNLVAESERREGVYQNEIDSLTTLIENGANDSSGSWDEAWNAIALAEKNGINNSLVRNQDFIDSLTEYFDNGGTDMSEAIELAMENVVGSFEEGTKLSVSELEYLYSHGSENLGRIMDEMDNTGLTFDEVCETLNLDSNAMKGYLLALADDGEVSMEELQEVFDTTGDSSEEMADDFEQSCADAVSGAYDMSDSVDGSLEEVQDELDETGWSAIDMGDDVNEGTVNAEDGVDSLGNASLSDVQDELDDTGWSAIEMGENAEDGCADAQDAIDSVEGKEENVVLNFFSNGFSTVMSNLASFITQVAGAKNAGKSDSFIEATNFGDNYMEDLYGLKDAGIKTISLANLDDGISAYATKDSSASSMVNSSVANYNYNNAQSTYHEIGINPNIFKPLGEAERSINININIESMNGTQQDLDKLIKMIDERVKMKSKRW